jgi:HEAT repeat protein
MSRLAALALALLACSAPVLAQEGAGPRAGGPTPEQVKAAVDGCKAALKSDQPAARAAGIEAAAAVEHEDVAREIAGGLRDRDEAVQLAAMKVLGRMQVPEALHQLHRLAKSDLKKLEKKSRVQAALYRAIGQHGDKSSVEILADDIPGNLDAEVVRARIYGLGNIRAKESIEELLKGMNLGNPLPGEDSPFMPDVRVALARLTGTDQTTNKTMWQEWWNKNKSGFKIAPTPPEMSRELQQAWDDYWGDDLHTSTPAVTPEGDEAVPGR